MCVCVSREREQPLFRVNKAVLPLPVERLLPLFIIARFSPAFIIGKGISPPLATPSRPTSTVLLLFAALSVYYWEQDAAFKAKLKEIAYQKLSVYLDKLEARVKSNGGYFVRGKVINCCVRTTACFWFSGSPRSRLIELAESTSSIVLEHDLKSISLFSTSNARPVFNYIFQLSWPDLLWASYNQYLSVVLGEDPNKDHPELKNIVQKVQALPSIKAYLEKRPKTQL